MVVSTYQAASGAGAAAMEELVQQTREVFSVYYLITLIAFCLSSYLLDVLLVYFKGCSKLFCFSSLF